MPVQTTYSERHAAAFLGMVANSEPRRVVSRVAEGALAFGAVACRGTADNQVKAAAASVFDAVAAADAGNTGNGVLTLATPKVAAPVVEGVYRVRITEPAANAGSFTVERPDGVEYADGTVAVAFDNEVRFTLADGATDFVAGDSFTITVTATDTTDFEGITLKDSTLEPGQSDAFIATDIVPVMKEGVVWVTTAVTVVKGQAAYFVPSTGAITNVDTPPNIRIPRATFDSSGTGLVKLRLS